MSGHIKRLAAPKNYPILRKTSTYVVKINCGPHPKKNGIPLAVFLRDLIRITSNYNETKKILNEGKVLVDGTIRTDPKFPVGLMDVISIPSIEKNYRVMFKKGPKVEAIEIPETESKQKPCRIKNITMVSNGKIQINFSDGKNIITENKEFKTGDTIIMDLPELKVKKHIKFEKDAMAYITDGKHIGETAKIVEVREMIGSNPNRVILVDSNGETFETLKNYIFIVGKEKPELKLSE